MTNVNSILLSLKKSLAIRGSDIDEVIEDFDRRHSGQISSIQFQRLISSCGVFLPPQEYEYVLKSFLTSNNMVDLNRFSEAVKNSHEEVKSIGDIMKSNLIDLHNRLSQRNTSLRDILRPYDRNNRGLINKYDFLRAVGSFPSSQAISEAFSKDGLIVLSNLLQEYEKLDNNTNTKPNSNQTQAQIQNKTRPNAIDNAFSQSLARNLDLRSTFFNNDRLKSGKMSQFHFQNTLNSAGLQLTPNDTAAITRYYQCDYDLIDYFHFLRDEEQYRKTHSRPTNASTNTNPIQPLNLNEILKRISTILLQRKVHPSQIFPPNSNRLTKFQFSSSLRQAGLMISLQEIDSIANSFECEDDKNIVNVSRFIGAIQSLMSSVTAATIRPSQSLSGVRQRNNLSSFVDIEAVLRKIAQSLRAKNIQLAPRFQKFDREKSGEFNVSLVNAVIKNVGIDPLNDAELEALQSKFPGNVYPNIQWEPFTTAVDPQIQPKTATINTMSSTFSMENDTVSKRESFIPSEVLPLLQYIRQTSDRYSMNMLDEFRLLDRLRVGFVQPTVFVSFMSHNFPKLNRNHVDELLKRYGASEFHYIDFCIDIDKVGSNRDKNASSLHPANINVGGCEANSRPILSKSDTESYQTILQKLKAFCTMKMLSPLEIFTQHDTSKFGFVLKNHLEGCFNYMQIPVTKDEVNLLIRMFNDKDHEERVYYRQIVQDIEKTQINPARAKWLLYEPQMKNDAAESAVKLVAMIRGKLDGRNRSIRMYFRDAQRGRMMSKDEFLSRLQTLNIVIQGDDLDVLLEKYSRKPQNADFQQSSSDLVDWESFVNDVENSRIF